MAFFALIYGPKLGAQICMSSEKLLDTNQKFKEGVKAGSDDARNWKNKESISPLKLSDYINKKK